MANNRKSTGSRGKSRTGKRKSSGQSYTFALYAVCLIAGLILGAILFRHVTKNDGFTLIGGETVTLRVGDDAEYIDPGVSVIRFGVDYSEKVVVETNLKKSGEKYIVDTAKPGSYYISYTADVRGYGGVKLIRTIRVMEDEET